MNQKLKTLLQTFFNTTYWSRLRTRLIPMLDMSAWVLLFTSAVPLLILDPRMLVTLITWSAYGIAIAGIAVMLNRLVLPQLRLNDFLSRAKDGSAAASIVVAAVLFLLGMFFLGLVLCAKT